VPAEPRYDVVIVGGGLQGALLTLALLQRTPALRLALVEQSATFGGNHTWCLHPADAPASAEPLLSQLIAHSWDGYEVRFPGLKRQLSGRYAAVTSARLHAVLAEMLEWHAGAQAYLGHAATEVAEKRVVLSDGTQLQAELVFDARGPESSAAGGRCGYQKFVGLELDFAHEHGVERPILMDVLAEQGDGFHFMYVLPLSPRRLLVEDTTFSRSPRLDLQACAQTVRAYARAHYGEPVCEVRQEHGILPMTWARHGEAPQAGKPLVVGYRGGFFHPATGYSFPVALRVALCVAKGVAEGQVQRRLAELWRGHRQQARHAERLNWLAFHAFAPEDMGHVFERFYRLSETLIHHFYALQCGPVDWLRIVVGRPPKGVSLKAVWRAV